VLGNLFQKIQPLLVDQKAPLELVVRFALSILPLSLMYTVPWGFLSAVLLVFSKLSSEHEITGFRIGGTSLFRLAMPVFLIGAVLSLTSLWVNINVVPHSKATSVQLLYDQASRNPESLRKPGVAQGNLGRDGSDVQKLLIQGRSGEWVTGFHFYQLPASDEDDRAYVYAERAALAVDRAKSQLRVKLEHAFFETRKPSGRREMAFAGLAEPLLIDLRQPSRKKLRASAMTNAEIRESVANTADMPKKQRVKLLSEITKRYAFSMACISFAFVGVPLGLSARRRDSSGGLLLSLIIAGAYFLSTIFAEQFRDETQASIALWMPNVACVLIGLFLFRRARFR